MARKLKIDNEIVALLYNNVAKELGWKTITAKDVSPTPSARQILFRLRRERLASEGQKV